jgi:acid ceramidase
VSREQSPARYRIDLRLPEDQRWAEVVRARRTQARRLVREFKSKLSVPAPVLGAFRGLYRLSGGRYAGEMSAWADALGVSAGLLTVAQCSYELAMAGAYLGSVFGCTAAVVDRGADRPVHLRFLDWELPGMREATAVFEFRGGAHDFSVVGLSGFVGALTGIVPGGYSVAINQAPASEPPGFDFGPSFLVREVLETCATYDDAVYALKHTRIAAPVFFTVCGTRPGQGCVVERRRRAHRVRRMRDRLLVQANHHVAPSWRRDHQEDVELQDDSELRQELAERRLRGRSGTARQLLRTLEVFPIESSITVQKVAMEPRTGAVVVKTN